MRLGVPGRLVASLFLVLAVALAWTAGASVAQPEPSGLLDVRVGPNLILVGGLGANGPSIIEVELAEAADVRIRITDFDGRTVREILDAPREAGVIERRWNGRDDGGRPVPLGPYFVVATADAGLGLERVSVPVAVASSRVYPKRPGFITVVLDPGHGGPRSGAKGPDGTREADLNLDIAARIAAMLEAAGVNVILTRTTDAAVNQPAIDRSRDGVAVDTDELAARTDIANHARADLFIAVHNNSAVNKSVGGPSTFFSDERPYQGRSARLASIIQSQMHRGLSEFATAGWEPFDHGVLTYPYYVLRGFDPPRLRRPSQMPAVLSEGMFLTNPRELRLLKRPLVRQRMAVAYYEAIARYLQKRGSHIGYDLVSGPDSLGPGETATYEVEIRNSGTTSMRRWQLPVGVLCDPYMYEGRGRYGAKVGQVRIPRLAPGDKTTVRLKVKAPARAGRWQLIFDARTRDGDRTSRLGAPALQVLLTVIEVGYYPRSQPMKPSGCRSHNSKSWEGKTISAFSLISW